jgi:MFS family permease
VIAPPPARPSRTRYKVVAMAFLLALVLYMDRTVLSIAAGAIRADLHLSPLAMGWVFSAFVWGYALFHIPMGWLGDRWGARRVLAAIVVLWSACTAGTALAWSFASLLAIRCLFGAAEAGAAPNVSQAFSRWIPAAERGRAQGFFFAGMGAGGAIAAPAATFVLMRWGWRAAFFCFGAAGLAWAASWYLWFRDDPARHPAVNAAEMEQIRAAEPESKEVPIRWRELLGNSNLRAILTMYFTYGYTGYIYITWFPTYLTEARHLSLAATGMLSPLPTGLSLLAKPLGGWWSDRLSRRHGLRVGRRVVGMTGFGLGAAAVLPGLLTSNPYAAAAFLGFADGAAALAHGICFAVCLDVGLKKAGIVSALMLTAGSLGNALSALAFGAFLQTTGSWIPPFALAMVANLTGALLWLRIDPEKPVV